RHLRLSPSENYVLYSTLNVDVYNHFSWVFFPRWWRCRSNNDEGLRYKWIINYRICSSVNERSDKGVLIHTNDAVKRFYFFNKRLPLLQQFQCDCTGNNTT